MDDKVLIVIIALVCLTTLEVTALIMEVDGAYFMPIVTAIGSIVGGTVGLKIGEKTAKAVLDKEAKLN